MSIFANPYLTAIGIPIILLFSGAVAKKLVRKSAWRWSDFFLGVELSLSAIAAALVYVGDLAQLTATPSQLTSKVGATGGFLVVCFGMMFVVLAIHQDWENKKSNKLGQIIRLGIVANTIGISLLFAFIFYVKGV